jgi:hypothetical protein
MLFYVEGDKVAIHTQALIEKCIVLPSNRKELPVLSGGGGWDALDPTCRSKYCYEMNLHSSY